MALEAKGSNPFTHPTIKQDGGQMLTVDMHGRIATIPTEPAYRGIAKR